MYAVPGTRSEMLFNDLHGLGFVCFVSKAGDEENRRQHFPARVGREEQKATTPIFLSVNEEFRARSSGDAIHNSTVLRMVSLELP